MEPGADEDGLRECSAYDRASFKDSNVLGIVEFDYEFWQRESRGIIEDWGS